MEKVVECAMVAMRKHGLDENHIHAVIDEIMDEIDANNVHSVAANTEPSLREAVLKVDERLDRLEQFLRMQFVYY